MKVKTIVIGAVVGAAAIGAVYWVHRVQKAASGETFDEQAYSAIYKAMDAKDCVAGGLGKAKERLFSSFSSPSEGDTPKQTKGFHSQTLGEEYAKGVSKADWEAAAESMDKVGKEFPNFGAVGLS